MLERGSLRGFSASIRRSKKPTRIAMQSRSMTTFAMPASPLSGFASHETPVLGSAEPLAPVSRPRAMTVKLDLRAFVRRSQASSWLLWVTQALFWITNQLARAIQAGQSLLKT
jgi:hypothetical protein